MRAIRLTAASLIILYCLSHAASAQSQMQSDRHPMGFMGLGLKIGVLHYGNATYRVTYTVNTPLGSKSIENKGVPQRTGLLLSIPINVGTTGIGWVFDPYMGFGDSGSFGIYTGPTITAQLCDACYLSVGFGARVGLITANFGKYATDMGLDAYGRIPINFIYYLANNLGFLFELGVGYGGTGYKPVYTTEQLGPGVAIPNVDLRFGHTYQIDASAGVRFP